MPRPSRSARRILVAQLFLPQTVIFGSPGEDGGDDGRSESSPIDHIDPSLLSNGFDASAGNDKRSISVSIVQDLTVSRARPARRPLTLESRPSPPMPPDGLRRRSSMALH